MSLTTDHLCSNTFQSDEMLGGHWIGNRIATAMLYVSFCLFKIEKVLITCITIKQFQLNDVPFGGRTAFPKLGVATTPVKGSMVFWYSILNDGSRDMMSLHGGCPTAYGIKWGM